MSLAFEWDSLKAAANVRRHGITFTEASSVFGDTLSIVFADPLHSAEEDRFILIGHSGHGRLLVVVHSERGSGYRIISARLATSRERQTYEQRLR